jgi:hypothetical protein
MKRENKILDLLIKLSRLERKTLGFFIRSLHVHLPIYFLIFMCYAPKIICKFIFVLLIIITILFIVHKGCFLSRIETYIDEQNINIVDPVLEVFGYEKNKYNMSVVSILGIVLTYITLIFIYHYRFKI